MTEELCCYSYATFHFPVLSGEWWKCREICALQKHSCGSLPHCFSEQVPQEFLGQGEVALGAAPRDAFWANEAKVPWRLLLACSELHSWLCPFRSSVSGNRAEGLALKNSLVKAESQFPVTPVWGWLWSGEQPAYICAVFVSWLWRKMRNLKGTEETTGYWWDLGLGQC